ncbi:hypothetical protein PybrP1_003833 [[Pythium] brassicae (nom. inval.)]|nr:hypothetical protein PybrP1_003833 [[Pythium] brassicae (nom. inval.)]
MAVEFVESANSADDSSAHGAVPSDVLALVDWATGDPEQLLGAGGADDLAAETWHMDSIDVASCFAGEPSQGAATVVVSSVMTAALHAEMDVEAAGSDPLFGSTLTNWWEQGVAAGGAAEAETKLRCAYRKPTSPLVAAGQYHPGKEVTDALLAVFAPHALVSDDSQTESESGFATLNQLTLSRSASSVSNASSSHASSSDAGGHSLPPRIPAAAKKAGKGKPKGKAKALTLAAAAAAPPESVADDELGLTPLEVRRKRNRESMQRARRRQRDDVEEMKETLQELELHYQRLAEAAQERRSHNSSSSADGEAAAAAAREVERAEADYYAAADLSHTLQEEKFLLERMLTDKQKTFRRMQQVMVDRVQELALPSPTAAPTAEPPLEDFEFAPITAAHASALVRQCYQMILQFQDTAAPLTPPRGMSGGCGGTAASGALTTTLSSSRPFPPAATFGWKVTCHVTPEQNFFVSFAKYFKGVSAEDAMLATWTRARDPHVNRSPNRRLYQYKVLQVINDSTYVAGIDIHHPVKKNKHMRNVFCRFRLQTSEGVYVIGRASMNPTSPELRRLAEEHAAFEYVDNYSWIEFSAVVDEDSGERGVWVKFNVRTEYNTQEDSHLRLVNSLYVTLQWESAVIPNAQPTFFLPS